MELLQYKHQLSEVYRRSCTTCQFLALIMNLCGVVKMSGKGPPNRSTCCSKFFSTNVRLSFISDYHQISSPLSLSLLPFSSLSSLSSTFNWSLQRKPKGHKRQASGLYIQSRVTSPPSGNKSKCFVTSQWLLLWPEGFLCLAAIQWWLWEA